MFTLSWAYVTGEEWLYFLKCSVSDVPSFNDISKEIRVPSVAFSRNSDPVQRSWWKLKGRSTLVDLCGFLGGKMIETSRLNLPATDQIRIGIGGMIAGRSWGFGWYQVSKCRKGVSTAWFISLSCPCEEFLRMRTFHSKINKVDNQSSFLFATGFVAKFIALWRYKTSRISQFHLLSRNKEWESFLVLIPVQHSKFWRDIYPNVQQRNFISQFIHARLVMVQG